MESVDYSIGAGRFWLRNSAPQAAYGERMALGSLKTQPKNAKGSLKRIIPVSGCLYGRSQACKQRAQRSCTPYDGGGDRLWVFSLCFQAAYEMSIGSLKMGFISTFCFQ